MGYWADQQNPYVTYRNSYIESLWNVVKNVNEQAKAVNNTTPKEETQTDVSTEKMPEVSQTNESATARANPGNVNKNEPAQLADVAIEKVDVTI